MTSAARTATLAALVAILTFALYLPSLRSGFVYDAQAQIRDGAYVHDRSHFADVLTLRVLSQDVLDGTRPVHLLSLMTDSLLWGHAPFGYHLTSILLHALNAALLFLLLARLVAAEKIPPPFSTRAVLAVLCALLFAAHPVNTEAVAEVSDREDLLATFFLLSGIFTATFFPGPTRRTAWLRGSACVLCLLLAAGSKETGVLAPVLLGCYWMIYRRRPLRSGLLLATVAFVAIALFVAIHLALQPAVSRIFVTKASYLGGSLGQVFLIQPRLWAFLLWLAAWPVHLSADYTVENVRWITLPAALVALAIFLLLQIPLARKSRLAFFGAAIFWIGLVPVSNFAPLYRPVADRFLYLPSVGLAAMLCGALALAAKRRSLLVLSSAAGIFLACALGALTRKRQEVFANSLNLWHATVEVSPTSSTARDNLGYALYESGDFPAALEAFRNNLNLTQGKAPDSWNGAALVLEKNGRPADAEAALRRAIALDPMYASPQKLLDSLTTNPAQAAVMETILRRIRAAEQSPPAP